MLEDLTVQHYCLYLRSIWKTTRCTGMGPDQRAQTLTGQSSQVTNFNPCPYLNKTLVKAQGDKRGKNTDSNINTVTHLQLVSPIEPPTYSIPISPSTRHGQAAIFSFPLQVGLYFPKFQTQCHGRCHVGSPVPLPT